MNIGYVLRKRLTFYHVFDNIGSKPPTKNIFKCSGRCRKLIGCCIKYYVIQAK